MTRIPYINSRVDGIYETWERRHYSDEHGEDGAPVLETRQI